MKILMLIFAPNVITGLNPDAVTLIVHAALIALKNLYHTNNAFTNGCVDPGGLKRIFIEIHIYRKLLIIFGRCYLGETKTIWVN
jgi:hypothetical protein